MNEPSSNDRPSIEPMESLDSIGSGTPSNVLPPEQEPVTHSDQIDLGVVIQEVNGSWDKLKSVVDKLPDDKKKQNLSNHFKPTPSHSLHSHPVTKNGKTWNVSFQLRQFPWLSNSSVLVFAGILYPLSRATRERRGVRSL